ncbi:MAG: neutral/alkaline non-lysosomal ceramidase N-terminal domain-containing protein [Chloroflexi bacterium]|nr:neutral/alkaline non-lysosomal ceramidase N-terminal domain-containing protein [Chloroflexota bacterium]
MANPVQLGTASINITPSVGTWMGGYSARDHGATDIHDDLYAKILVFSDGETKAAVVTCDLVGITEESTAAVRSLVEEQTDIPGSHVMITCSHTHSGPTTREWRYDAPFNTSYMRELERKLAGGVQVANQHLQPAVGGLGAGSFPLAVNRRLTTDGVTEMRANPDGVVDHTVAVLRFDKADGTPLATAFHYACHSTSMGASNYAFSADYAGGAKAFVEKTYGGGHTAAFLLGCCGNTRPNFTSDGSRFRSATFDELESVWRGLGAEVVNVRESIDCAPLDGVAVAQRMVTVPLREVPDVSFYKEALETETWPDTQERINRDSLKWVRNRVSEYETDNLLLEPKAEIQVIRVGNLIFASFPGEVFLEYGLAVQERVKAELGLEALHVELANGMIGYVPTADAIPHGGYEVMAYRHGAQSPAGYSGDAETLFVDTAVELAHEAAL